jgi:hypothetical protein
MRNVPYPVATILALLLLSPFSLAESERFQSGHDLRIAANEVVDEATCLKCSIHIAGQVQGDATAIGGNVILENGAQVHGDTTALMGDVRMEANATADGDVAAVGGKVWRDPHSNAKGEVASVEPGGWMILLVAIPFAFMGGAIALIVWMILWLVRRNNNRQLAQPA